MFSIYNDHHREEFLRCGIGILVVIDYISQFLPTKEQELLPEVEEALRNGIINQ